MNKISNQFASIEQVTDQYLTRKSTDAVTSSGVSFEDILKQKQDAKSRWDTQIFQACHDAPDGS